MPLLSDWPLTRLVLVLTKAIVVLPIAGSAESPFPAWVAELATSLTKLVVPATWSNTNTLDCSYLAADQAGAGAAEGDELTVGR